MSGRRSILEAHRGDPGYIEAFHQTIEDVVKGKTPLKVAAEGFGMSEKTFQREMANYKTAKLKEVTYAKSDVFEQNPGVADWIVWVKSRFGTAAQSYINKAKLIWEEVWEKKPLSLLSEADIVKGKLWVQKQSQGSQLMAMLSLRALIRGGYGQHGWLSKHLTTRGYKFKASFPPEMTTEAQWRTILPRLYHALDKMFNDGTITPEEYTTFRLLLQIKVRIGARTGNATREMETWGIRLNAGKTNVRVEPDGSISSWTFYAKGKQTWGPFSADISPSLKRETEQYISDKQLKNGDYLITGLDQQRAGEILRAACKIAELTPLRLHDFRRMSGTGRVLAGIPMEVACDMGVGWKDIKTMKEYYMTIKGINAAAEYQKMEKLMEVEA